MRRGINFSDDDERVLEELQAKMSVALGKQTVSDVVKIALRIARDEFGKKGEK